VVIPATTVPADRTGGVEVDQSAPGEARQDGLRQARQERTMTLVLPTTHIQTLRRMREPVRLAPRNDAGQRVVADGYHYRSIGSLQALALALAASAVTPALLWLAL
jgi:hypothetical protein